jgi:hypothetical protein
MKKSPWSDSTGSKNRPRSAGADESEETEDPLNPAIPKAPLIPHDIARMPNAALPVWSRYPDERGGERPTLSAAADGSRDHVDARPPPGATPSTYQSAAMPPHTESLPRIVRGRADPEPPPVTMVDEPTSPGSPRPTAVERQSQTIEKRPQWPVLLLILVALAIAIGVWMSGVLN